jgi:hypothetical protein
MTYAAGGLIQAADFNSLAGGAAGANVSTELNTLWATGRGNAGYGQTAVSNVSVGGSVAATNWADLINKLNSARKHQGATAGSGILPPVTGNTIAYLSTLAAGITTGYNTRLTAGSVGTTASSSKSFTITAAASTAGSGSVTFNCNFGSVDKLRYFFNAVGRMRVYFISSDNTGGTARGTSMVTLCGTNYNSKTMYSNSWSGRAGTGGTLVTDTTAGGYYGCATVPTTYFQVNGNSYPYTGDYCYLNINTAGGAGSYGGNGSGVTFTFGGYSGTPGSTFLNDTINTTITMGVIVQYPETTNLANSWGTVTIT